MGLFRKEEATRGLLPNLQTYRHAPEQPTCSSFTNVRVLISKCARKSKQVVLVISYRLTLEHNFPWSFWLCENCSASCYQAFYLLTIYRFYCTGVKSDSKK